MRWIAIIVAFHTTVNCWPALQRPRPKAANHTAAGDFSAAEFPLLNAKRNEARSRWGGGEEAVVETKSEMSALLANEKSGVQEVILSYEGHATLLAPLKIELTVDGSDFVLADFTQFGDLVEKVEILQFTRQIICRIKSIGNDRSREVTDLFQMLEGINPIFVVEVDSKLEEVDGARSVPPLRPNDRYFSLLWYFNNKMYPPVHINIQRAWQLLDELNLQTQETVVGLTSNEYDITHPEIVDSVWTNDKEVEDGLDNDGNGCIDDIHGCNLMNNPPDGHVTFSGGQRGTIMAGVIAAKADNKIGIAGMSRRNNLKVLPLQLIKLSEAVQALNYFYNENVKISSHSIIYRLPYPSLLAALERAMEFDHLSFWPAGDYFGDNVTNNCFTWPSAYDHMSVVIVAGVAPDGTVHYKSNFGNLNVHFAAPAAYIVAPIPGRSSQLVSGSHVATALVSGVASLVLSAFPSFNAMQLKRVILESYRRLYRLEDQTIYPGIPDCARALQYAVCEKEFEQVVNKCDPQPTAEHINFWRNAGSQAKGLATKCQATCNRVECIKSEMATMTPLCHNRYCDILDGVCEDMRNIASSKSHEALPSFSCESKCFFSRVRYSGFVEFRVASQETKHQKIDKMAKLLGDALMESLPVFEAVLDGWKYGAQLRDVENNPTVGEISFVYRLSSHTASGVGRALRIQIAQSNSRFMLSTFAIKYCRNPVACKLHYSSEFDNAFHSHAAKIHLSFVAFFLLVVLSSSSFYSFYSSI